MEENEIVKKYGAGNYAQFNKLYIGSASGTSKKGNPYCFCRFLEINRYGNGDIVTLSCRDGQLPKLCESLKCGDVVEVLVDVPNMVDGPVLVDITKKLADSKIV